MLDLITIGDATHDVFLEMEEDEARIFCTHHPADCQLCFNYNAKIPVTAVHHSAGGNAANVAVGLARLGLSVAIYTHLGDDETADLIQQTLQKNKVDTQYVLKDEGRKSNYSTIISVHGERSILVFHVPRSYSLPAFQPSPWIYLTSMKEGAEKIYPALIHYLVKHKTKLVFQPGTFQLRQGPRHAQQILQHTTLLILNREEAAAYLDQSKASVLELLEGLQRLGPKYCVITDGAKGTYAHDGQQAYFLETIPNIPLIEATGAGDSFATGVTAALMRNHPLPEALRWGQVEAASVIQKIGAQAGLLHEKQLSTSLALYPTLQTQVLSELTSLPN